MDKKKINTYKIIDNATEQTLYITCIYKKAVEWQEFYEKKLNLNVRIECYEY